MWFIFRFYIQLLCHANRVYIKIKYGEQKQGHLAKKKKN